MSVVQGNSAIKNVASVGMNVSLCVTAVGIAGIGIMLVDHVLVTAVCMLVLGECARTFTRAVRMRLVAALRVNDVTRRGVSTVVSIPDGVYINIISILIIPT